MQKIIVKYVMSSPMFMAGAQPENEAEFRISGFNGVLRFWYRALAWCVFQGDLNTIKQREIDVFGGLADSGMSIKRSFQYRMHSDKPSSKSLDNISDQIRYLGFGVVEARKCIDRRATLEIGLHFWRRIHPENEEILSDALKCLGMLGGVGGRSRNGFGSLTIVSLTKDDECIWTNPDSKADLEKEIRNLQPQGCTENQPLYTAFSPDFKFKVDFESKAPLGVLTKVGKKVQEFRKQHKHHDAKSVRNALNGVATSCPKRAIFGLPHNYFFKQEGQTVRVKGEDHERRASPLFIHVHKIKENLFVGVLSLFPAVFLPVGRRVIIQDSENPELQQTVDQPDYELLSRLMNA